MSQWGFIFAHMVVCISQERPGDAAVTKSHCLKTQKFRPLLSFEMAHTLWNGFLPRPLAFQGVPYSVCGMSVQFTHSAMCNSLWPHGLQHAKLVHHQFPELAQTQILWVADEIQPSHALSSPSPPAFNLSQHQGLFQWISSSHQVAKVLELQLQHQSFQCIFKIDFL